MAKDSVTRRDFVKATAVMAAAGAAAGVSAADQAPKPDVAKIVNYNEKMEYRRLGRTGLMISAVCLGGHWKRIETMTPDALKQGGGWLGADINNPHFQKNRYDVVTRCIEAGINHLNRIFITSLLIRDGAAVGALSDVGINDEFMKKLAETMHPESSVLFVLVRKATPDKVLEELKGSGGKILKTSLSDEDEAKVQAALDAAQQEA